MDKKQCSRQQQTTTKISTLKDKTSLSIRNKKYEKLFKMRTESPSESSTESSDSLDSVTSRECDSSLVSSSSDGSFTSTPRSPMSKARSVLMPDNAMEMIVQRLMSLKVSSLSRSLQKRSPAEKANNTCMGSPEDVGAAKFASHAIKQSGSHGSESDSIELSSFKSRASTAKSRDPARLAQPTKQSTTSHTDHTRKSPKSSQTKQNTTRALSSMAGANRSLIVKRKRRAKKSEDIMSPFKMYTITDDYPLNNNFALHPIPSESSHELLTKNKLGKESNVSPRNSRGILSLEEERQEEIEEVISLSTDDEIVQFSNKWERMNEEETCRKINKRYVFTKVI